MNSFSYTVAGQVSAFSYGNGVSASFGFNAARLQLESLSYANGSTTLLSLAYGYTQNGGNNGQITSITDNTGTQEGGRSVNYTYDALHRLKDAVTTGSTSYPKWGLQWSYDRYGNRLSQSISDGCVSPMTCPTNLISVSTSTNRLTESPFTYDENGNMTNDGLNTLTYDAENRLVSSSTGGNNTGYVYDGAGLRVKKCMPNCDSPTSRTVYVFSGSKVIAEYDNGAAVESPTREYIYSGSALVATHEGGALKFHYADHLSTRVSSDASGNNRTDQGHYPYGESCYNSTGGKFLFTSYERDNGSGQSGNDYAMYRYHISRLGRFNTPDPLAGSVGDPQSFNRYLYVGGDPINLIDPLGLTGMHAAFNQRMCLLDGQSVPCSIVYSAMRMRATAGAVECTNGICPIRISKNGQLYEYVLAPAKKRSVDVKVDGVPSGGTDHYEWELQLRVVKTNEWIDIGWYRTFFREVVSWENFGKAQQEAWDKGYYSCIGKELWQSGAPLGPIVSHTFQIAAEAAVSHTSLPEQAAGAYYHVTDGRFTAWGKHSKVLVPKAAQAIRTGAKSLGAAGWVYFYYKSAAIIGTCAGKTL